MTLKAKIKKVYNHRVNNFLERFNKENDYNVLHRPQEDIFIIYRPGGFTCASIAGFELRKICIQENAADALEILYRWVGNTITLDKGFLSGCTKCSAEGYIAETDDFCDCEYGREKQKQCCKGEIYNLLEHFNENEIIEIFEFAAKRFENG